MGVKEDIHRYLYGTKYLDLLLYELRYDHSCVYRYWLFIPHNAISHTDVIVVKFSLESSNLTLVATSTPHSEVLHEHV